MPPRRRTAPPRPSRLVGLPTELLTMIASYLTLVELARVLVLYRDWHGLFTATPFLWQLIHIDFKEYPDFPVVRFLGYSQGLPLSLCLRNIRSRHIEVVMTAVGDNLHRMRVLKVWFYKCFDGRTARRGDRLERHCQALETLGVAAPVLQEFAISTTKDAGEFLHIPRESPLFGGHAPRLVHATTDSDFELNWHEDMCPTLASYTADMEISPSEVLRSFPHLQVVRFCGDFISQMFEEEDNPADAALWRGVSSVGWEVSQCSEDACDRIISWAQAAKANGVREFIVRATSKQDTFVSTFLDEADVLASLCVGRGGYDFGLQYAFHVRNELFIQFSTPDGLSFTVGELINTRRDEASTTAAELFTTFETRHFAALESMTICESVCHYIGLHMETFETPQLQTLTIWIVPCSQRGSPSLFDCESEGEVEGSEHGDSAAKILSASWQAPKLRTLYLGSHPEFPVGSGGHFIREWQEDFIVAHVREVTAVSVAEFILDHLTFNSFRLAEILLARDVVFSEGFHSEETDRLRELTDDLRYLHVGESVAGVERVDT